MPGPTGPASYLMYESASGNAIRSTPRARKPTPRRCATPPPKTPARLLVRRRGRLCAERPHRPGAAEPGRTAGLRPDRKNRRVSSVRTNVPIPTFKIWNQDTENLESRHRRVSISHQVITRNCSAFDPPIDASGLDRGLPRWSPGRGCTFSSFLFEHDLRANASRLSRGKTGFHFSGSRFMPSDSFF